MLCAFILGMPDGSMQDITKRHVEFNIPVMILLPDRKDSLISYSWLFALDWRFLQSLPYPHNSLRRSVSVKAAAKQV